MRQFKDLKIWQKGIEITAEVYKLTKKLPSDERFGLVSQLNRSAVSVPSNIAEGAGRESKKDFERFLDIAVGSSYETETQLLICERIGFLKPEEIKDYLQQIDELQRMIRSFKESLNKG